MSVNTEELKRLAAPLVKWGADSAWENPSCTAAVGYIDEDGNRDPILTVDTTIYDGFEGDSLELANFYAAANPATILELIQQRDELLAALKALDRGCRDPRCIGVLHGLDLARTAIAKAEG